MIYFIYFLDNRNRLQIKNNYSSKYEAINNMENIAIDYIRELQGKQQVDVCKQYDKNIQQLKIDTKIKEGLYLMKEGELIVLYEKSNTLIPGTFWNNYEMNLIKIGFFGLTEYYIEQVSSTEKPKPPKPIQTIKTVDFVSELKKRFNNGQENFGLRKS